MAIADRSNLEAARTSFETLTDTVFKERPDGEWSMLTKVVPNEGGARTHEVVQHGALPIDEEWTAAKTFDGFRTYKKSVWLKKRHASMKLDRMDVEYDKSGVVGEAIKNFFGQTKYFYDRLIFDSLLANPTGIDGVSLLNDSHPHGPSSGTWDNKVADALSFASMNSGIQAMRTLRDEKGEYLNVEPQILLVGPDLERTALEITGADSRPIGIDTTGSIVTSGATLSESITNVYKGRLTVVVSKRFAASNSTDWLLVDPKFPPMGLFEGRRPTPVIQDRAEDEARYVLDEYRYSVEFDVSAFGLNPWGLYGKLS